MKDECTTHKPITYGHWAWFDKLKRAPKQRQCPTCLRWYFHGEFGRGWAKALKPENRINNILKP